MYFIISSDLACLLIREQTIVSISISSDVTSPATSPCHIPDGGNEGTELKLSVMHFFWLGRLICLEGAHYIVASSAIADDIAEEYSTGWIKNYKTDDQESSTKISTPISHFANICAHSEFRPGERFLKIDWTFCTMWRLLVADGESRCNGLRTK